MQSPAEALGQSATALARRVDAALGSLDAPALAALEERLAAGAAAHHVVYLRDDAAEPVHIFARPVAVLPEQLSYARHASLTIHNALVRLPQLYLDHPHVRDVLRLSEPEEAWLRELWTPAHREVTPVFGRLDAVLDFASPRWKETLCFLEPNLTGIGGLHLAPTVDRIVARAVGPVLAAADPGLALHPSVDPRELLMQELVDHLELIGRRGEHVCFVEPKYAGHGIDEQEEVARYLHARHGLRVMHADPAELSMRGGEVVYDGAVVDVAYRDYGVLDLLELADEGVDVTPMRTLLRENRMVSSIAGELDQKSCWELLTDPAIAGELFSAEERRVFRRHVAWTRLVAPRRTTLPDGRDGDLLAYVAGAREHLVLKPNRGYGGEGVLLGPHADQARWEAAIAHALADPDDRWVVQALTDVPIIDVPVVRDGAVASEALHLVLGFVPSKYGLGLLARASGNPVVNVTQRGGMCAVLVAPLVDGGF